MHFAGCRFPDHLRVEVDAQIGLPPRGEPWLTVDAGSQERAAERARPARLVVREGTANASEIRLDKARTNIGRVVDVYRDEGLYRRNDLAFVEDTPVNRSVSREHAHILFDRPRASTGSSTTAGTSATAPRRASAAPGSSATE